MVDHLTTFVDESPDIGQRRRKVARRRRQLALFDVDFHFARANKRNDARARVRVCESSLTFAAANGAAPTVDQVELLQRRRHGAVGARRQLGQVLQALADARRRHEQRVQTLEPLVAADLELLQQRRNRLKVLLRCGARRSLA